MSLSAGSWCPWSRSLLAEIRPLADPIPPVPWSLN